MTTGDEARLRDSGWSRASATGCVFGATRCVERGSGKSGERRRGSPALRSSPSPQQGTPSELGHHSTQSKSSTVCSPCLAINRSRIARFMFAASAEGQSQARYFLPGGDCRATLGVMRALGVPIEEIDPTTLRIEGRGLAGLQEPARPLDCVNSGTTMRPASRPAGRPGVF